MDCGRTYAVNIRKKRAPKVNSRDSRLAALHFRLLMIRTPADAKIRRPCALWEKFHKPKNDSRVSAAASLDLSKAAEDGCPPNISGG